MRIELIKSITAVVGVVAAFATFGLMALETAASSDYLTRLMSVFGREVILVFAVVGSAYVAITSLYLRRYLENRHAQRKQIFMIHSRADLEQAQTLSSKLKEMGFNPWLDVENLVPGQKWANATMQALEESSVALFLVSKNSTDQETAVGKELTAALRIMRSHAETDSPVIPVKLGNSDVPKELKGIHWVDLHEDKELDRLRLGLERALQLNVKD